MLLYAQPIVLSLNYNCHIVSIIMVHNTTLYSRLNEWTLDKIINTIYTAQKGSSDPVTIPLVAPLAYTMHAIVKM